MREHRPLIPGLQAQAAEEGAPLTCLPGVAELLLVDKERRCLIADQGSPFQPFAQRLGRRLVGIAVGSG